MSSDASATAELRRSFSLRVAAAAVGMASAMLLTIVVVRSLVPHEAATFFAILAALSVGPLIGRLGLGSNAVRLIPAESNPGVRRHIAGTHLQATFVMSGLSAPIIAVIGCNGLIGHSNFLPVLAITTLVIMIESLRLMVSDIFAAAGRVGASVATMHYIRSLLVLPCVAIAVYAVHRPSLFIVLAAYLAASAVQLAAALMAARRDISFVGLSTRISSLRHAVGQGTQLFGLELSKFLMMQGTIWLATSAFHGIGATQYAIAVTLAMQVTILESLTALALVPPAARLWAEGKQEEVLRMLSNAATLNTAFVLVVVGLLSIFGPLAITVAYGADMRPAATKLLILAFSGICQAYFSVSIIMLIVTGHIGATARVAVRVLIAAVPCAIAAAWLSGPVALAIVTSVSVSAMSFWQWVEARKLLGRAPCAHLRVIRAARELRRNTESIAETQQVESRSAPTEHAGG